MAELARHAFSKSGSRLPLFLGADRKLGLIVTIVSAGFPFAMGFVVGIPVAIITWSVAMYWLRRMAKADPMMRLVYSEHIRYKDFYPAKSGFNAVPAVVPKKWEV